MSNATTPRERVDLVLHRLEVARGTLDKLIVAGQQLKTTKDNLRFAWQASEWERSLAAFAEACSRMVR